MLTSHEGTSESQEMACLNSEKRLRKVAFLGVTFTLSKNRVKSTGPKKIGGLKNRPIRFIWVLTNWPDSNMNTLTGLTLGGRSNDYLSLFSEKISSSQVSGPLDDESGVFWTPSCSMISLI